MIKSMDDLLKIKNSVQKEQRNKNIRVFVGLSSCGIAAGAEEVYEKLHKEIEERNLSNVELVRTGCVGYCFAEPTIEIQREDKSPILLGNIHTEDVESIIELHIVHGIDKSKYMLERSDG